MKNAVHYLLKTYKAKLFSDLLLQECIFKNGDGSFYLSTLPLPGNKEIKLCGKKMQLIEHHITIPEKIKSHEKSEYHYTLIIRDKNHKYKVHVHFNKQDHITLEPALFEEIDGSFVKTDRSFLADEVNSLLQICLGAITPTITRLRARQEMLLQTFTLRKTQYEKDLTKLSLDLAKNKAAYIDLLIQLIGVVKELKSLGDTQASAELVIYRKILASLTTVQVEVPTAQHTSSPAKEKSPTPTPIQKAEKQTPSRVESVVVDYTFVKQANALLNKYNACQNAEKLQLTPSLFERLQKCDEFMFMEKSSEIMPVLELQLKLKHAIAESLTKTDLLQHWQIYAQAYQRGIVKLDLPCLRKILEADDAEKLKLILNDKLLETLRYRLTEKENEKFTLVEWAIHFQAIECVQLLLERGFSLDYISESKSPIYEIMNYPKFYGRLSHFLKAKNLSSLMDRIAYRTVLALENELAKLEPTAPNQRKAKVLNLRIELAKTQASIKKSLDNNKALRTKITNGQEENFAACALDLAKYPSLSVFFKEDIDFLTVMLRLNKAYLELLPYIGTKYRGLIHKPNLEASSFEILDKCGVKKAKGPLLSIIDWNARSFELYKEILEAKLDFKLEGDEDNKQATLTARSPKEVPLVKLYVSQINALKAEKANIDIQLGSLIVQGTCKDTPLASITENLSKLVLGEENIDPLQDPTTTLLLSLSNSNQQAGNPKGEITATSVPPMKIAKNSTSSA